MRTQSGHRCYVIGIGMRGRAMMPCSEACIHMQVADHYMDFIVIDGGNGTPFVQLFVTRPDVPRFTEVFSMPITQGEAGLYRTEGTFATDLPCYYFPHSLSENKLRETGEFDELADQHPVNVDLPLAECV